MIKTSVPYLVYNDDCKEALSYYVDIFGAEIIEKITFEDMGFIEELDRKSCIGHSVIKLGQSLLYAADTIEKENFQNRAENTRISIWLEIDSTEEINELEKKMMRTGSTSILALHETFWDSKYTKIEDKFGIIWELNAQL